MKKHYLRYGLEPELMDAVWQDIKAGMQYSDVGKKHGIHIHVVQYLSRNYDPMQHGPLRESVQAWLCSPSQGISNVK